MLNTVMQKHWRKTQLWGLHKTQGGSMCSNTEPGLAVIEHTPVVIQEPPQYLLSDIGHNRRRTGA